MYTGHVAVVPAPGQPPELIHVDFAAPRADEVLVRVAGSGICQTDLHAWRGRYQLAFPAVLGHEGAGVVVAVGTDVTRIRVGQHVVLTFDSCGTAQCRQCSNGLPSYCSDFMALNFGDPESAARARDGAIGRRWFGQSSFATYAAVREHCAVPVPDALPLHLLGPLGCGLLTGAGAVFNDMALQQGESIAVFGAGAVGLAAVMAARVAQAAEITVIDRDPTRLEVAAALGATRVIESGQAVPPLQDAALDTTGSPTVVETAMRCLDRPGQLVLVGGPPIEVNPLEMAGRQLTLSMEGSADPHELIPRLCDLWGAGEFPFETFVTTYPLTEISAALSDAAAGRVIKTVLVP